MSWKCPTPHPEWCHPALQLAVGRASLHWTQWPSSLEPYALIERFANHGGVVGGWGSKAELSDSFLEQTNVFVLVDVKLGGITILNCECFFQRRRKATAVFHEKSTNLQHPWTCDWNVWALNHAKRICCVRHLKKKKKHLGSRCDATNQTHNSCGKKTHIVQPTGRDTFCA